MSTSVQKLYVTKAYNTVIDKFMPLTKLTKKQRRNFSKPWITPGLKASSDKKHELFEKWKFSNC